ncbi:hypothetical protein [Persephonella sp.]
MTDYLVLLKPLAPYIPTTVLTIIAIGIFLFKVFSKEKELISRIDSLSGELGKLTNSIQKLYDELKEDIREMRKDLNEEKERRSNLEVKLAEKYLSVDRWLEINNKFEASVKQELLRIHESIQDLNKILIEVLKDDRKTS